MQRGTDMEFSRRLNYLIKQSGLTQRQVSFECSVSQSTVSKWVHGKCEPSMEKLKDLSCLLDCIPLDYLIFGNQFLDELLEEKYGSPKLVD